MPWPLSRYQDFTDDTTPSIKAAFLHAVQDAINAVFNGTQSLKALVVDGIGGVTVAPVAGLVKAVNFIATKTTMAAPAGSAPRTTGTEAGELTRGLVPMAVGRVLPNGTLKPSIGIYDVTHTAGTGIYTITLTRAPSSVDNFNVVLGMCDHNATPLYTFASWYDPSIAAGRITFKVHVYGMAGPGPTDESFSFVAYGE